MNYYIYILGTQSFLDNCKEHLNSPELVLSLTSDIEIFKSALSNITKPDVSFVVVEDKKVSSYNRKHFFFGSKTVTYDYLREISKMLNANTISFEIKRYKEIEYKILDLIKRTQEENLRNTHSNLNLIKKEEVPDTSLITQEEIINDPLDLINGFDISEIIKEANEEANDFDEDEISKAIEQATERKEFSSKKVDNIKKASDVSDEGSISQDEIEQLKRELMQDDNDKKQDIPQTPGQALLNTYDQDTVYDMINKGESIN